MEIRYFRPVVQRLLITFFLLQFGFSQAQSSFFEKADTLHTGRLTATGVGIGTLWTGSIIGLSQVWYGEEKTKWHAFDDSRNWLQMDKVGHVYTANKISILTGDLFRWSGMSNKRAAWIGFGIGTGYQLTFEMLDAYSPEWGFSWSDVGANTLGSAIYLGQQLGWKEQRFHLKFSAHLSPYAQYRPEVLGSGIAERLLKDYNGQTYWLSVSPGTFGNNRFPKWLCFSIGYSADQKLVGDQDYYEVIESGEPLAFNAKRQFLFSLDIDFSRIPVKRPWLKVLIGQLNYLKIPFPALIVTGNTISVNGFYF